MKITLKSIYIFVFLLLPAITYAAANTYYVTQNGNGVKDGKSLGNAWSVSDFNSSANWSTTDHPDRIDPGDTVYLCDTITSGVIIQGSGIAGNVISIRGDYNGHAGIISRSGPNDVGIEVIGKDYIKITELEITGGKNGIDIYGGSDYVTITNCLIHDLTDRGIHATDLSYVNGWSYLTIGGVGNGNIFYDIGTNTAGMDINVSYGSNYIISYNTMYATKSDNLSTDRGIDGIHSQSGTYGLIEYNNVYDHNDDYGGGARGEDGIDIKEGCHNVIIRFNHIYGHEYQTGVTAQAGAHDIYIYGNNIHDNNTGILVYPRHDSDYVYNIYIWSNILYNNAESGIILITGGPNINNVKIYNNTIAQNGIDYSNQVKSWDATTHPQAAAIRFGTSAGSGWIIKNNIFYKNRPNENDYRQVYVTNISTTTLSNNQYYWPSQISYVYWDNQDMDISELQSYNQEPNALDDNPSFTDAENNDYTLTDMINYGEDLSKCLYVNLSGGDSWFETQTGYSTVEVCFDDALDPNGTDWTTTPPTVSTVKRDTYGWSRGAYVHNSLGKTEIPPTAAPAPPDPIWVVQ